MMGHVLYLHFRRGVISGDFELKGPESMDLAYIGILFFMEIRDASCGFLSRRDFLYWFLGLFTRMICLGLAVIRG